MDEPLLQVRDLTKTYTQHRFLSRKRREIPALRGVSLSVRRDARWDWWVNPDLGN